VFDEPRRLGSDWRITVVVASAVALPFLVLLQFGSDTQEFTDIASESGLIAFLILLAAAILVYFCWRVSHDDATGWACVAMSLSAVQGIALQARSLVDPDGVGDARDWLMVVHIVLISVIVLLAIAAQRRAVTVDPLAFGVVGGVAFAVVRWVLSQSAWALDLPDWTTVVYRVALGVACGCLALALLAVASLPWWVRVRLAVVAVLLTLAYLFSFPVPVGNVRCSFTVATYLLAAVVSGSTSFAMLRAVLLQERAILGDLRHRLDRLETLARADRARLHEIGATIAGIRSASDILETDADLHPGRRSSLISMVGKESARLERLLRGRTRGVPTEVDVDRTIAPVVERQRAVGQRVTWTEGGLRAWARADELAEVVSILLDNAARHAPESEVVVTAHETGPDIEIVVADSGPGVPDHEIERVFEWGHKGPASRGHGIGLAAARQLLADTGGSLHYEGAAPGARLVLTLPRSPAEDADEAGLETQPPMHD
jgi:signal transduction histidine kinase